MQLTGVNIQNIQTAHTTQQQKTKQSKQKIERKLEQIFFQRGNADGQQAHEKMLNIANHQGNSNQNHNETLSHTCQTGHHQKDNK